MCAPVIQTVLDHLDSERDQVAHPDEYLETENWATGFEFAGGVR
jgi:hypothetical protein